MAVKIRLRRTGRKKQPSYRIVVADSASPRDGAYLDLVGTYNPLTKPAELRINLEKVDAWTARGADMSETVRSLVRKARAGGDDKVALRAASESAGRQESARVSGSVAAAPAAAAEPAAPAEQKAAPAERKAAPAEQEAAPAGSGDAAGEDSAAGVEPAQD